IADLARQVGGELVDVVGQVLPRAEHARDLGLAAEAALGADLPGHPGDLVGEAPQLVDHRVDGVLQLRHLTGGVDGDLLGEVALGDGGGDLGDVADLARQVPGQLVDVVGQRLPRARHSGHVGLPAELAVGSDLPGDAGDLVGEAGELVDHRVDGVLQLGHLAPGLDGDLLRQVAPGHGLGHLGDVADLAGEVAGELVDVVGQRLPRAGDARDLGLAAEAALGPDLPGDPGHLVGEGGELVDHRVDRPLEFEDLAPDVDEDLLRQVAVGHGGGDPGDVAHLVGQVGGHEVHRVGEVLPRPGHARHAGLAAEAPVGSDLPGDAGDLVGEAGELVDHRVDGVLQLGHLAPGLDGDLLRQVAPGHGGRHLGDVADLAGQVGGQLVDVVGQVLPGAAHALDVGLAAEAALGADLPGHPGDLVGEGAELVDHRVDGVLQPGDLAGGVDGDLLGEVALGHGGGDLGDVADLAGEVAGQLVDVV